MKPLTDFLPEVMPSVIGCPVPLVINAVRNSVIEFLAETGLLEQTIEVQMEPGVSAYEINTEAGIVATRFLRGYLDTRGHPVVATTPASLDADLPNWRNESSAPRHAFVDSPNLIVHPVPTEAGVLFRDFAYTLARSSTRAPDEVLDAWAETIASGALKRLLILPGTAWLNPELAVYHSSQFSTGIDKARISKIKGASLESLRVSPRAFQ